MNQPVTKMTLEIDQQLLQTLMHGLDALTLNATIARAALVAAVNLATAPQSEEENLEP